jgi:hypothetical protein
VNLDIALQIVSVVLTVLLAAVGIEMANNPPTNNARKWMWRLILIVLGLSLIVVNSWQSVNSADEQAKAKVEASIEQKILEAQYNQVQGKLDTIANFIAHPPSNLNPNQVTAAVHAMTRLENPNPNEIKIRACWTELVLNKEVPAMSQWNDPMDCRLTISSDSLIPLSGDVLHISAPGIPRVKFTTTPEGTDFPEDDGTVAKAIEIVPAIRKGSMPFPVTLHLPRTPSEAYWIKFEIIDKYNQSIGWWGLGVYRVPH